MCSPLLAIVPSPGQRVPAGEHPTQGFSTVTLEFQGQQSWESASGPWWSHPLPLDPEKPCSVELRDPHFNLGMTHADIFRFCFPFPEEETETQTGRGTCPG